MWLKCTLYIKVSTARSDVCFSGEKHRNAIREPVTNAEKLEATVDFLKTPSDCRAEKKPENCDRFDHGTKGVVSGYGPTDPCSKPLTKAHYTFDFSKQTDCFASLLETNGSTLFLVHLT